MLLNTTLAHWPSQVTKVLGPEHFFNARASQRASSVLKKLYPVEYLIPSSAAAEHLFSYAGLTMSSNHTRMSNELFANLVMLKVNKDLSLMKL